LLANINQVEALAEMTDQELENLGVVKSGCRLLRLSSFVFDVMMGCTVQRQG
jgi:hypothetical protein